MHEIHIESVLQVNRHAEAINQRDILAKHPETPGSLAVAISEAVEDAVTDANGQTRYSLGSVLNHVMLHQTIIDLEAPQKLAKAIEKLPKPTVGRTGKWSDLFGRKVDLNTPGSLSPYYRDNVLREL